MDRNNLLDSFLGYLALAMLVCGIGLSFGLMNWKVVPLVFGLCQSFTIYLFLRLKFIGD